MTLNRRAQRGSQRGVEKYLGPGENVIYTSRRHFIVLDSAVCVWIIALVLAFVAGLASRGHPRFRLASIAAVLFLVGTAFLGWKGAHWWKARYVLTNTRVLLVEGVLSRRVMGLPLRKVIDTTYHRTLAGRLFGYGDLELNLSGQPGLRKLTALPQPDTIYHLILSLTTVGLTTVSLNHFGGHPESAVLRRKGRSAYESYELAETAVPVVHKEFEADAGELVPTSEKTVADIAW